MSAKHTPGIWMAECVGTGGDHSNPVDIYEISNGFTRIAEHVAERDAYLIAAAPAMYEALKELREAAAAMSRVIAAGNLVEELTAEFTRCQIAHGFGVRVQSAVALAEQGE